MATVESLISAQASLIDQMNKFISNTKKTGIAKRTHGYYVARVNGWHDLWQKFLNNESQIAQLKTKDHESLAYFTEDIFSAQESIFYEFKGELLEHIKRLEKAETTDPTIPRQQTSSEDSKSSTQSSLPRITLPNFSGDYNDWVSFRDLFVSVIHQNQGLEDVQKFHYLKTTLTGDAANVIKQYSITQANYASAWKALIERYENKRILVSSLLKTFTAQPKIPAESANALKSLLDVTSECLASLRNIGVNTVHWDPLTIHLVVHKLPLETHKAWEESISDSNDVPTWDDFKRFLEQRFRTLEANHSLRQCPQFLKLEPKNRLKIAKSANSCTNCLGLFHSVKKCLSKTRCSECGGKHHTLLHLPNKAHISQAPTDKPRTPTYDNKTDNEPSTSNVLTYFTAENNQVLLATAIVQVDTPQGLYAIRALIDPGSQATFITAAALKRLKLGTSSTRVAVTGLGNSEAAFSRRMAMIVLHAPSVNKKIETNAIVLDRLTDLLPSKAIVRDDWAHLKGLALADPSFNSPNQIDILIGADIYPLIILDGVRTGAQGTPIAQNTIFGWILSGKINSNTPAEGEHKIQSYVNFVDLSFDLRKFWEIEEMCDVKTQTLDDEICENIFQTTHSRKPDGKYVVRLPFKYDTLTNLGATRNAALKCLLSVEKTVKQKGYFKEYNEVLNEYLTLKHMEEASIKDGNNPISYFPHHGIIKESSTTTKLRVVFNASYKSNASKSLNDVLYTGPALQQDLTTILLRWRFHKYVFSADIEKMYRQIWVHHDDIDYQRILWRPDPCGQIKDYRLLTVTFGVACAPYLAIRTLHQLAADEQQTFPEASECLLNDFYVDDVLTGRDTIQDVNTLKNDLIALLKRGGFHLRKFTANHANILNDLPAEDLAEKSHVPLNANETIKALGITWNPKEDSFYYKLNIDFEGPPTKRHILSKISKLFDPLGWISPIIICGKIFVQSLWLAGVDWDSLIPAQLGEQWSIFVNDLKAIERIQMPRWINFVSQAYTEFHGFCDSSELAYAAAVYARIQQADGEISTHLIISKTRVAPVKTLSIPRLELCGAHLLSKLVRNLKQQLGKTLKFHLWSDSTVVLAWIKSHPSRWKSFVANRVSEIHSNAAESSWGHVPSEENPADLASRGVFASDLLQRSEWWTGPSWLRESSDNWPSLQSEQVISEQDTEQIETETKKIKSFQIQVQSALIADRFSNYVRACRTIACCYRFIDKCRSKARTRNTKSKSGSSKRQKEQIIKRLYFSPAELYQAKISLMRESQRNAFHKDLENLLRQIPIAKKSTIKSLDPFLDQDNLLRVGGRLEESNFPFSEKHPIILPYESKFTELLIEHAHKTSMHGGPTLTCSILRKEYWIIRVKKAVKKVLQRCIPCLRWKQRTASQIMGNLPRHRITLNRPFYAVGIDFAGPIPIKLSRTRNAKTSKAYIAIFICFATKAVHIEAVSDLSSEAFLAALRRFFSRRGISKDIYSDNGTNFVGASKILKDELNKAISHNISIAADHFAIQNINWHFIPPGAPHFGGLWEAGVKSIKHHLRRIIGQTLLTFEELITVLTQIEAVLNSRPLCPLSSDPEDLTSLTPGHFLIGDAPLTLPEKDCSDDKISLLSRWKFLQKIKCDFWKRWSSEYVSRLQQRHKWRTVQPSIKVGDLALLKEDNLPPSAWKLARILEVHAGKDNHIRVVTLKTASSQLKRPITKVCVLPFVNKEQLTTNLTHH